MDIIHLLSLAWLRLNGAKRIRVKSALLHFHFLWLFDMWYVLLRSSFCCYAFSPHLAIDDWNKSSIIAVLVMSHIILDPNLSYWLPVIKLCQALIVPLSSLDNDYKIDVLISGGLLTPGYPMSSGPPSTSMSGYDPMASGSGWPPHPPSGNSVWLLGTYYRCQILVIHVLIVYDWRQNLDHW